MPDDCKKADAVQSLAELGRVDPLKAVEVLSKARALCDGRNSNTGGCVLCGLDGECEMSRSLIEEAVALVQYPDRYEENPS